MSGFIGTKLTMNLGERSYDIILKNGALENLYQFARLDRRVAVVTDAGVPAELDVYHSDMHAFDMMRADDVLSIQAAEAFNTRFADAQARFFAPQHEIQEERHDS